MRAAAATLGLALAAAVTTTANAADAADPGAGGGGLSGAQPGPQQGVHLSWVRGEGAGVCPDAAAIESEVSERLGGNPFARTPTQFIEAIVTQKAEGFQVTIAMRGGEGKLIGSRALTSSPGDCRSIATAAALTIAILIDPDALARAPAPKPAPAPPPPPPAPAADLSGGRVTAVAGAGWGQVPGVAPGGGLSATIDVSASFAIGVAAVVFPEQRTAAPDDGFAFGLTYAELVGCFVPLAATSGLRLELCAGANAGILHAVVYSGTPTGPGQRWTFAVAQLTRVIIPIYQGVVAEIGLEATEPLARREFFVAGKPAGMDTVFTQPVVAVAGWAGVGLRWK